MRVFVVCSDFHVFRSHHSIIFLFIFFPVTLSNSLPDWMVFCRFFASFYFQTAFILYILFMRYIVIMYTNSYSTHSLKETKNTQYAFSWHAHTHFNVMISVTSFFLSIFRFSVCTAIQYPSIEKKIVGEFGPFFLYCLVCTHTIHSS